MKQQAKDFLIKYGMHYSTLDLKKECRTFIEEMNKGLQDDTSSLAMIPTYLSVSDNVTTQMPAMVIDAGGTNFRVGSVTFNEALEPTISDFSKTQMPGIKEELSKEVFFNTLVDYTKEVAVKSEHIGFCFSYPASIGPDKDATLLRWSKEVKAPEVVGEKIGKNLVEGLQAVDGKQRSCVILNDTVATLLGGKGITAHRTFDSYIGFIFGTGTNMCYIEDTNKIKKLNDGKEDTMIVNMESGAYNKLVRGVMDEQLDQTTSNPGDYQFEKMVSGRYLGELTFLVLKKAAEEGLFSELCKEALSNLSRCELVDVSLFMANPHDKDNQLVKCIACDTDRTMFYYLIDAMIERAAKACAMQLSSVILKTNKGLYPDRPVAIVAEGTTFFKLKGYKEKLDYYMKAYLNKEEKRYYEFVSGEDLNLIGTALAALLK